MATVVNKTDPSIILRSVDTSKYSETEWFINPSLEALQGVPAKYWKVVGTDVVEMDATEKAAVDAAETTAQKQAAKALDRTFLALLRLVVAEVNELRTRAGLPTRTANQIRQALFDQIDQGN